MSRFLILLLLLLSSACTTSHQEDSTPLAQTPSASVASPSGMPSATLLPTSTATIAIDERTLEPTPTPVFTPGLAPPHEAPMVVVPAGEFLMGSTYEQMERFTGQSGGDPYAFINELYQFRLELEEFEIDQFEVTNYQFHFCVKEGICEVQDSYIKRVLSAPERSTHPVVLVSHRQAANYCAWVGKRLPMEAEWEKAARGMEGRIYPWGNEWQPERLNIGDELVSVGMYPSGASPYGAMDMAGNAAEWTQDSYTLYPGEPQPLQITLPVGEPVFRGGRIWLEPQELQVRTTVRGAIEDGYVNVHVHKYLGFRCVRGPKSNTGKLIGTTAPMPLPTAEAVELSQMSLIPAGSFMMGVDEPRFAGEMEQTPAHEVYLDAFYLDQYEVSSAQFVRFLNALGRHRWACHDQDCIKLEDQELIELLNGDYRPIDGKEKIPVQVTWLGAQAYCEWLGKRLPTEAEWEKAARGSEAEQPSEARYYPWGNEPLLPKDVGSWFSPSPVGSHPLDVSPYQVFDLYGNAREWTADWYERDYYASSPVNNPVGAEQNSALHKSIRSGITQPTYLTYRSSAQLTEHAGFRCAVSDRE